MAADVGRTEDRPQSLGADMVALPGGTFVMGSDAFYPDEGPRRRATVAAFAIDRGPVTNAQFAAFVATTGHVTMAEIAPNADDYPGLDPADAAPGSLVFRRTATPVPLDDPSRWWEFVIGADWRHPLGPDSDLSGLDDHPVVHVAWADADAYARWAGKSLPTEAEWEYAARGGSDTEYAWGDELAPDGAMKANYWQGLFPFANQLLDGWERTSPVGAYAPNGFGLADMIGNVWEWTSDRYASRAGRKGRSCCGGKDARRRATVREFNDVGERGPPGESKVIKGGSYLCAPNYCQRYRPAARQSQTVESSTGHIGFRCVRRSAAPLEIRSGKPPS